MKKEIGPLSHNEIFKFKGASRAVKTISTLSTSNCDEDFGTDKLSCCFEACTHGNGDHSGHSKTHEDAMQFDKMFDLDGVTGTLEDDKLSCGGFSLELKDVLKHTLIHLGQAK
jgi:hypothetical protein